MKPNRSARDRAPPCVLCVFGATGDLTKRLLLPSLLNLIEMQALGDQFRLLGVGRKPWNDQVFRRQVTQDLQKFWGSDLDRRSLQWLLRRTFYQRVILTESASYGELSKRVEQICAGGTPRQGGSALFYLALAPDFTVPVAKQLVDAGMMQEQNGHFRRLVVEKPFGTDLDSARALNSELGQLMRDEQIFRIDHFAGKDAVQDLAVFRFCNSTVEPLWNRAFVDHVQITVAEQVSLEDRAEFYDRTGALRDMVPNHLAQLLSLIAMEPPDSFSSQTLRAKQVELLQSVRVLRDSEVARYAVRGQYGSGRIHRKAIDSYRREPGVPRSSRTETFAALRVDIDNWRWAGVPFFLRTGKSLARPLTEVAVQFRQPPTRLLSGAQENSEVANTCVFQLQPNPGIRWRIGIKAPGLSTQLMRGEMGYEFPRTPIADHAKGYERLLIDAMRGDQMLFQSAQFAAAGWRMVQPILTHWSEHRRDRIPIYKPGSAGPRQADEMLKHFGFRWRPL